jgi:hypothetical protein
MQKDGTYRVVYGTDLDKITGRVKLSVVGYGRKTQEGGDSKPLGKCHLFAFVRWWFVLGVLGQV